MQKRELILQMIQQFTNHAPHAPQELLKKLEQVKSHISELSNEEVEMLDGPSTIPASEKAYNPENPLMNFATVYSEMEKYAYTGEKDEELYHVIQQMRGFFDIPDRYYP